MRFSDYKMLLTQMRDSEIEDAINAGDTALVKQIKRATDEELYNPDDLMERAGAMLQVNVAGRGMAGLTDKQRKLFGSAATPVDVWRAGTSSVQILAEMEWKRQGRPYYNVWPSMVKSLTNCNLKGVLGCHVELPMVSLLIRFPEPLGTIFYYKDTEITFLWREEPTSDAPLLAMFGDKTEMAGASVSSEGLDRGQYGHPAPGTNDRMRAMLSTVAGIALLSHNKDIIEPIVLNADAQRFAQTKDPALIEKAKRKGTFGFNVGRHIETAPGFRQAHFAIRWKGSRKDEGGLRPELVPVKGCLVHRKLVTEVPTGYLDKDETVAAVSEGQD